MTVMQKEDEVGQEISRKRYALSLSIPNHETSPSSKQHLKRQAALFAEDVSETTYPAKRKLQNYTIPKNKKINTSSNMLNGYRSSDIHHRSTDDSSNDGLPVATLSNMGNTCYLNSVLYTLRFAPSFLHNLHHLVADLSLMHSRLNQTKAKSSSLGRNIGSITGPSSRSSSSKDLLSLGSVSAQNDVHPKTKMQIATEKLHELYMSMHSLEMKDNNDSYQPASFLQALIDVNSLYQGNQQQDAHELLVYLLDILRETCDTLAKQAENQADLKTELVSENAKSPPPNVTKSWGVRRSWKKHKDTGAKKDKMTKEKQVIEEELRLVNGASESDEQCTNETSTAKATVERLTNKMGFNFVSEDFGGVTVRRTKCLECESVTERKEPFYDICVPIPVLDMELEYSASELYRQSCVTYENLRDSNKYWCEQCVRYNEASREVSYERLPRLLVLQLKRFSCSTSAGGTGTEKMNNYMPTPLLLECFCDKCSRLPVTTATATHTYRLYAVISHLGQTMASGHYVAYTRAADHRCDYAECCRDHAATLPLAHTDKTNSLFKFLKPKSDGNKASTATLNSNGLNTCKSMDCCGIKLTKSVIENAINNSSKSSRNAMDCEQGQLWLECDDDVVRTMSAKEFQMLLSKRNSPATPYLLFYSKITDNSLDTNIND